MTSPLSYSLIAWLPSAQLHSFLAAASSLAGIPEVTRVGLTTRSSDGDPPNIPGLHPIDGDAVLVIAMDVGDITRVPARVVSMFEDSRAVSAAWLARSRVIRDAMMPPATGEQTGWKLAAGIRRREDLDREEFVAYWRDRHAPIALHHHVGMWRYVQHELIQALTPNAPNLDGLGELNFGDGDPVRARLGYPDTAAVLSADLPKFVQPPSMALEGKEVVFRR